MNKYIKIGVVSFLIILMTVLSAFFYINYSDSITKDTNETITEEDFQLTTTYKQNNMWEYSIKGELPDKCYTYTIQPLVAESYPEQVQIKIDIKEIGEQDCLSTSKCPYIIDVQGVFNASEEAKTSLVLDISSIYLPEI